MSGCRCSGSLAGLAIACAVACWVNVRWWTWRSPPAALVLLFGSSFVLYLLIPSLFQRLYVKPSELELETPYIARNIASTRQAYNLQQIAVKPFPVEEGLSLAALEANRATIDNIRLWDWQPLMDTYAQLQEIRTYYKFLDMDIDRYRLGGAYQQVLLSARELEPALLPSNAQTWVNLHVLFTHGNGVVMSPVTRKSSEGLPIFYLQDIPPVATGGPADPRAAPLFRPGRASAMPSSRAPRPSSTIPRARTTSTRLRRRRRRRHRRPAWRGLFSWYYSDPNILLSEYITAESRILFHRNIQDRVRRSRPFLRLDHDPYIVVSDGRLVLDAGRLHHQRLVSLFPAAILRRRSTTSATPSRW